MLEQPKLQTWHHSESFILPRYASYIPRRDNFFSPPFECAAKLTFFPQGNPRSLGIRAVAKTNNLDLEIVDTKADGHDAAAYAKVNPLGLIPSFVGEDGFVLTESIAIAIYSTF